MLLFGAEETHTQNQNILLYFRKTIRIPKIQNYAYFMTNYNLVLENGITRLPRVMYWPLMLIYPTPYLIVFMFNVIQCDKD